MTRVTSRSEPLFQSVLVRLRFARRLTHIYRFSSGSLFAILKKTVRVRLRFDKNGLKSVLRNSGSGSVRLPASNSAYSCFLNDYFRKNETETIDIIVLITLTQLVLSLIRRFEHLTNSYTNFKLQFNRYGQWMHYLCAIMIML